MSEASFSKEDEEHIFGPAPAFRIHDRVRKVRGASWQGRVCGTYSTTLTPEGYMVESEREVGSVQFYPVAALEAVREPNALSANEAIAANINDRARQIQAASRHAEIVTTREWMREVNADEPDKAERQLEAANACIAQLERQLSNIKGLLSQVLAQGSREQARADEAERLLAETEVRLETAFHESG